jgi:DNA-binding transcriptional LysR family regulator
VITELRTLAAVARYGAFAAAGVRLGLTQAAVSGHIRRLEAALGFALFDRTGRSAVLNAAGLRTLARAEDILARFDKLGAPTRDEDWTGSLRIGAIASVQPTALARALAPFRRRFPRCRVHLSPGVSLNLMDQVDAGELDLAILIKPSFDPPSDMQWRPLLREDYVLLVESTVAGNDWRRLLGEQPFIRYDRASFGGRQVQRFLREASVQVLEWIEVDDIHAMVALVAQGLGVAIVPLTEAILPLTARVRPISLAPHALDREIGVLHRRPFATTAVEGLVDCLLATQSAEVGRRVREEDL